VLCELALAGLARLRFAVLAFRGFAEVFYFFGFELANLAGFEVEDKRAVADAADLLDVVANLFEHLAEFAVAAFDEYYFVPRIIDRARRPTFARWFAGAERADIGGSGLNAIRARLAFRNSDTLAEAIEGFFAGLAADFNEVGFLNVGGSSGELVGEFAVVGDEEKAFTEIVEAANRVEAFACFGEELHDGGAALGIADGGDVSLGLIEHEIALTLGAVEELAVDADVVAMGVGFAAEFGDDFAVYLNASLGDEFFSVAAAGDSGLCKYLLKAFEFRRRLSGRFLFFVGCFGRIQFRLGETIGGLLEGVACCCCGLGLCGYRGV